MIDPELFHLQLKTIKAHLQTHKQTDDDYYCIGIQFDNETDMLELEIFLNTIIHRENLTFLLVGTQKTQAGDNIQLNTEIIDLAHVVSVQGI